MAENRFFKHIFTNLKIGDTFYTEESDSIIRFYATQANIKVSIDKRICVDYKGRKEPICTSLKLVTIIG